MAEIDIFTNTINGSSNGVTLAGSDTLFVAQGVELAGEGGNTGAFSSGGNIAIMVEGEVFGGHDGINLVGSFNDVSIGKEGSVFGVSLYGIELNGASNIVVNDGDIGASSAGVDIGASGGNNHITNSGTIVSLSSAAILLGGVGNKVINTGTLTGMGDAAVDLNDSGNAGTNIVLNSGTMSGEYGMYVAGKSGSTDFIANSGLIEATLAEGIHGDAAAGGAMNITNSGTISGSTAILFNEASASGDTLLNESTGTVEAGATAVWEHATGGLNVTNLGGISGAIGILYSGGLSSDLLSNSGSIEGSNIAVYESGGASLFITNSGHIDGGRAILFASGSPDTLANTGLITASGTAVAENDSANLTVTNSGTISGVLAIQFEGTADSLDNSGTIQSSAAGGTAIGENGGTLDITNSGHIAGGIRFAGGANIYDGALGSVTGWVTGGAGVDSFTGGAGRDHFDGGAGNDMLDGMGGNDVLMAEGPQATIDGGDGNDTINMASFFNASDQIDGGTGRDTLLLDGDYSAGLVLGVSTLVNVEKIVLSDGFKYVLTTDDATVAAGAALTVDASAMTGGNTLNFNGSAETDGHFVISGSAGNDVIVGGAGNDVLTGNGGNNLFTGGMGADHIVTIGGHDHFIYNDVSESTGLAHDVITNFSATTGKFDLDVTVTGINTAIASGRLSAANFDANLTSAVGSAQLGAGHAVLFTPTIGNLAGHTYLIVDANGVAGYQAGQDYVFELASAAHLTSLATTDFI